MPTISGLGFRYEEQSTVLFIAQMTFLKKLKWMMVYLCGLKVRNSHQGFITETGSQIALG